MHRVGCGGVRGMAVEEQRGCRVRGRSSRPRSTCRVGGQGKRPGPTRSWTARRLAVPRSGEEVREGGRRSAEGEGSSGEKGHDAEESRTGTSRRLRQLKRGLALSVVTLAVGSRAAGAKGVAPQPSRSEAVTEVRNVAMRGGYDSDLSDIDLDDGEDFDLDEADLSELRQIGQELENDASPAGAKGGGDAAASDKGEDDDAILAQLTDMSDPSRRKDPYPWEGVNTKWMQNKDVSVVLPPEDRDGRQYLLEVKRDEITGEELSGTLELDMQKGGKIDAKALQKKYKDKLLVQTAFRPDKLRDMTYSQFWCLVEESQVQKARFSYDRRNVFVTTKPSAPGGQRTEMVGLPPDPKLLDHLTTHGVYVEEPRDLSVVEDFLLGIMRIGIPTAVGLALFYSSSKIGLLAEDKTSSFETVNPKEIVTTFKDVAGIDIIKDEVQEVVEFLRQPKRFLEMGIRTPAGVLLVGQPGTGKTLLARAVAAEANVPLINCSGAEFVDEYVGMGAAKIRDLFELAREKAPCVIFIDEFDGLGKARTGGAGSEEMHTCNQLLAEMDGFTNNTGVVVLAATNRAFVLDKAVLRPGRFDRVLEMPLPNREGRTEILEVHGRDKKFEPNVDLNIIAKATPGFTGAELMNLMNQSGLTAIRKGREIISQADVFEALDEIQAERLGESSPFSAKQLSGTPPSVLRKRMAIFATAKAMVGCILPQYHDLARVSVNPTGLSSTFAHFVPQEESVETNVIDRALLESELVVLMAGYCAEKLSFGDKNVSVLGSADVEHARALAKQMVCEYGYGKNVRMLTLPPEEEGSTESKVSGKTQSLVNSDIADLLEAAEVKAYQGLAKNWRLFESLSTQLYTDKNIMGGEFNDLLRENQAFRYPDSYLPQEKREKIVYPDHESELFSNV
ncbi:P-loop-containing nucleoside triphosphate hydrolase [Chloropicon primus]|uniref:P-loop-containing nucleoside triphosphate hydrolase n=3 Tax=Chloropicon primus TaxID=1764295 RepID=A0A5B8MWU9_9CHLO|nr:P-loop-containing nucleoside triphosphate hydrolase [Chloropicon primus]UPR04166.1 P-loop-containing nucleoside triphosphate hydrolase [Chloropicon primus]|eukprot:QDZ24957.1 P-loop-containing nucleoside triphosphate hydrolase [Chloropicon primus]